MTKDSLFDGNLVCYQRRDGYRFSVDAVLLVHFCLNWQDATILDLGCGCGILSLIFLYRRQEKIKKIEGLEYQYGLAEAARRNASANNYGDIFRITRGDLKEVKRLYRAESFTHVICNPPFFSVGRGRVNAEEEKYLARHQAAANLDDIVSSAFYVLKNKGIFGLIFPADALPTLLQRLLGRRMQPKRMRLVYSYPEASSASLVMVESVKNGGEGCTVLPPLYVYTCKSGEYTQEVKKMYRTRSS